jgi:single-strand DNA-binding protein
MAGLNVCSFTGRAGRDPELKYFESGSAIAQLTIAVDGWKRDSEPLWLNLKVWGKLAQVAADYVKKGSQIAVSGQLENETWTDRASGEKRSKVVLNVKELTLLGSKKEAGGYGGDSSDEDVPF